MIISSAATAAAVHENQLRMLPLIAIAAAAVDSYN